MKALPVATAARRVPSGEIATSTGMTPANFWLTVTVPSFATTVRTPMTAPVWGPQGVVRSGEEIGPASVRPRETASTVV